MGKASFNKHQRREQSASQRQEQRATECFRCRAVQVGQEAFDETLARYGVCLQQGPGYTIATNCPECGKPEESTYHGLTPELQIEAKNLLRMVNRDLRLRRPLSDELQYLLDEFKEKYQARCIALYGLVYLEADLAAGARMDQFFAEHAEEFAAMLARPPIHQQQGLKES